MQNFKAYSKGFSNVDSSKSPGQKVTVKVNRIWNTNNPSDNIIFSIKVIVKVTI